MTDYFQNKELHSQNPIAVFREFTINETGDNMKSHYKQRPLNHWNFYDWMF